MTTPIDGLDRLGSAALFLVVAPAAVLYLLFAVWGGGLDDLLKTGALPDIELMVIPLAAIATVVLHPGVWVIDEPQENCSLWLPLLGTAAVCTVMWMVWLGWIALGVVPAAAVAAGALRGGLSGLGPAPVEVALAGVPDEIRDGLTSWRPWLCAVVAFALIWYPGWGLTLLFEVSWAATAFLAIVAYCGMVVFPRLTASFAGGDHRARPVRRRGLHLLPVVHGEPGGPPGRHSGHRIQHRRHPGSDGRAFHDRLL